jgi:hypothetical protein
MTIYKRMQKAQIKYQALLYDNIITDAEFVIFWEATELLTKLWKKNPIVEIDNSFPIQYLEEIKRLDKTETDYEIIGDTMIFSWIHFQAELFNDIISFLKPKGEITLKITDNINPLFIYINWELKALQMPIKI